MHSNLQRWAAFAVIAWALLTSLAQPVRAQDSVIRGLYWTDQEQVTQSDNGLLVYSKRDCKALLNILGAGQWQITEAYLVGSFLLKQTRTPDSVDEDPTSEPRPTNTPRATAKPSVTPRFTATPTRVPTQPPTATPFPAGTFVRYYVILRQSDAALYADLHGTQDCTAHVTIIPKVQVTITAKDAASSYTGEAFLFSQCVLGTNTDRKTKAKHNTFGAMLVYSTLNGTRYEYEFEVPSTIGTALAIPPTISGGNMLRVTHSDDLFITIKVPRLALPGIPTRVTSNPAAYEPKDAKAVPGTVQIDSLTPTIRGSLTLPAFVSGAESLAFQAEFACVTVLDSRETTP